MHFYSFLRFHLCLKNSNSSLPTLHNHNLLQVNKYALMKQVAPKVSANPPNPSAP